MQKIAKNASILIWSVFLSMMVSVAFVSVSSNVTKNLKENQSIKQSLNAEIIKQNAINEAITKESFENKKLSKDKVLIFEQFNYIEFWLKENWEYLIKVDNNQNMTIIIENWSSVSYRNSTDNSVNWIVNKSSTFETKTWIIEIKNLWWYSKIKVSSEWEFIPQYKNYKIIQKIWSKELIKENWRIKIF